MENEIRNIINTNGGNQAVGKIVALIIRVTDEVIGEDERIIDKFPEIIEAPAINRLKNEQRIKRDELVNK